MDRYDSLGIGNRDTLIHSIEYSGNNDKYQFLVDFALSVIEPCSTVGLSELEINENSIEIYPNPVSCQFTIGGELNLYKIEILNATGQIYQTLNTAENSYTIDISNLPIVLYLVRVQNLNNNLITVQKILKE